MWPMGRLCLVLAYVSQGVKTISVGSDGGPVFPVRQPISVLLSDPQPPRSRAYVQPLLSVDYHARPPISVVYPETLMPIVPYLG